MSPAVPTRVAAGTISRRQRRRGLRRRPVGFRRSAWMRAATAACAVAALVLVLVLAIDTVAAAATAGARQSGTPVEEGPVTETAPTAGGTVEPAPGPADPEGGRRADGSIVVNGPQRTGRAAPSVGQRVADTLIWAWLLVALVGGPLWWLLTGRVRRDADPAPAVPQREAAEAAADG